MNAVDDGVQTAPQQNDPFRRGRRALQAAMQRLFWGTLVPLTVFLALGTGAFAFVAGLWLIESEKTRPAMFAALLGGFVLVLGLGIQWYVVAARIRKPLAYLDLELRGEKPWEPEKDVLLGSLRHAVEETRLAALRVKAELAAEKERHGECRRRLEERQQSERFLAAAETLGGTVSLPEFARKSAELIADWWPAAQVLVLRRSETASTLEVMCFLPAAGPGQRACMGVTGKENGALPSYRKLGLPLPLKEAFRTGSYLGVGLPVGQDKNFPHCRTFVALGLQHRGAFSAVVYALSDEAEPESASALLRVQPFLSLAYSRAMYARELEEAEVRDALTGTYTHSHFLALLRAEIARNNRYAHPVSCAIVDLDDLRRVNERYGAQFGDQVIAETAKLILEGIRSSDVVARVAGGQFAILFPESSADVARVAVERIRANIESHTYLVQRTDVERLTVSAGLAAHPPHGVTALALMDAARAALQEAKRAGKNRTVIAAE